MKIKNLWQKSAFFGKNLKFEKMPFFDKDRPSQLLRNFKSEI